jgi:hypothetical protein
MTTLENSKPMEKKLPIGCLLSDYYYNCVQLPGLVLHKPNSQTGRKDLRVGSFILAWRIRRLIFFLVLQLSKTYTLGGVEDLPIYLE